MNPGELFIVGFEGTALTDSIKKQLQEIDPAGIILYDSNIESREQVQKLNADLKELLGDELIITVDQEGGKVERLRKVATSLPSLWSVGRTGAAEKYAHVLGHDLLDLGFNMVLGPCVDLCTNLQNPIIGSRSLGADSKRVSKMSTTIIESLEKQGLRTCAKHFPGHGDTSDDSHTSLPVVNYDTATFAEHLKPFRASIDAGVSSIMVAHVAFPKVAGDNMPATLSTQLIKNKLRQELSYDGLVIGDEMTMEGIAKFGNPGEISKQALLAGCNILLWFTDLDRTYSAYQDLKQELGSDQDLAKAVEESILCKNRFRKKYRASQNGKLKAKPTEQQMAKIAKEAIEWVSPQDKLLAKIKSQSTAIVAFTHPKIDADILRSLAAEDIFCLDLEEDACETRHLADVRHEMKNYKNILVLTFQEANHPCQSSFLECLRDEGSFEVIQCSTDMPDRHSDINLFGSNRVHLQALLESLSLLKTS